MYFFGYKNQRKNEENGEKTKENQYLEVLEKLYTRCRGLSAFWLAKYKYSLQPSIRFYNPMVYYSLEKMKVYDML